MLGLIASPQNLFKTIMYIKSLYVDIFEPVS